MEFIDNEAGCSDIENEQINTYDESGFIDDSVLSDPDELPPNPHLKTDDNCLKPDTCSTFKPCDAAIIENGKIICHLAALKAPKYYCEVCKIQNTSQEWFEKHLYGNKHKAMVLRVRTQIKENRKPLQEQNGQNVKETVPNNENNGKRTYKRVTCTKCNKDFLQTHIKRHAQSCKGPKKECDNCHRLFPPGRFESHQKNCKGAMNFATKHSNARCTLFFITFQYWLKYAVIKYFSRESSFICGIAIGNELGIEFSRHCHAVIQTKCKMSFARFKLLWKNTFRGKTRSKTKKLKTLFKVINSVPLKKLLTLNDLQSCKSTKAAVKYVSKEDYRAVLWNVDKDYAALPYKCYKQANYYDRLALWSYPYCSLQPGQQRYYKELFHEFSDMKEYENETLFWDNFTLLPWQTFILDVLLSQNARSLLWVCDYVGNAGKSTFAKYLQHQYKYMNCRNSRTRDVAQLYNHEVGVCIDINRQAKNHVNYDVLEQFKDGVVFSAKYESRIKKPKGTLLGYCHLIVMANFLPDFEILSEDRWCVFEMLPYDHHLYHVHPVTKCRTQYDVRYTSYYHTDDVEVMSTVNTIIDDLLANI